MELELEYMAGFGLEKKLKFYLKAQNWRRKTNTGSIFFVGDEEEEAIDDGVNKRQK